MSSSESPSYGELKQRLEAAESALKAIREGRVDIIWGEHETFVVRLAKAEAQQSHLKQTLLAIRKVNQLIFNAQDSTALAHRTCAIASSRHGGIAMPGLPFRKKGRRVTKVLHQIEKRLFELIAARLHDGHLTRCARRALASPGVIVTADPLTECDDCPLSSGYAGRSGMRSAWPMTSISMSSWTRDRFSQQTSFTR